MSNSQNGFPSSAPTTKPTEKAAEVPGWIWGVIIGVMVFLIILAFLIYKFWWASKAMKMEKRDFDKEMQDIDIGEVGMNPLAT